jgi:phosphate transport system protein
MKKFEQELATLKQRVLDMGALAESMVNHSWQGVAERNQRSLERAAADEPGLDRFQVDIDREAIRLIAIYAPVARDLRLLLMIARITSELERIGDQAVDNCEYARLLNEAPQSAGNLATMAGVVRRMLNEALQTFRDEDAAKAQAVMQLDDQVDALYSAVFRELLDRAGDVSGGRAQSTGLILLARSLERIADHATNVCEEVFYMVEGADIRHQTVGDTTPTA